MVNELSINEKLLRASFGIRGAIIHQFSSLDIIIEGIVKYLYFIDSHQYYELSHNLDLSNLLDEVRRLKYHRNVMAHWLLKKETGDDKNGLIVFYQMIDTEFSIQKPKEERYTKGKIEGLLRDIKNTTIKTAEIMEIIKNDFLRKNPNIQMSDELA